MACEIYPEVFVVKGRDVLSTYAGPANGHCPCGPLSPDVDAVFGIDETQLTRAVHWATSIYRPLTTRPLGYSRLPGSVSRSRRVDSGSKSRRIPTSDDMSALRK